jgi:hypothetical protein
MTVPQLLNLGLSGFALSGADVGGFAGSPPPDLTRWLQLAAFQPIDRDHAAKGTRDHEPWVDGPEQKAIRRHFIEERYRLMTLYTIAEETSRTGLPIMRPLFLEFPDATTDGHPIDLTPAVNSCLARACSSRHRLHRKRAGNMRSICRQESSLTTGPESVSTAAPGPRHVISNNAMQSNRTNLF